MRMMLEQWILLVAKYGQVENESKVFAEVKCSYMSESDIIYFKKARQYTLNIFVFSSFYTIYVKRIYTVYKIINVIEIHLHSKLQLHNTKINFIFYKLDSACF